MSASSKRADFFPSIFTNSLTTAALEDETREQEANKKVNRPKFVPQNKTIEELFDPTQQISAGPLFQENFNSQHDNDVVVTLEGQKVDLHMIESFNDCGFTKEVLANIHKKGYSIPTQIQKATIPLIKNTQLDIMAHAQTGCGKTAAFLLPLIDELQQEYLKGTAQFNGDSPHIIVIAPTRELVIQLTEDARSFAFGTSVTIACAYGDVPMQFSIRELRKGCDLLITTIGRLLHYLEDRIISLNKLRFFVFDEADKFLSEHYKDMLEGVRAIKSWPDLTTNHRTLMFSATFTFSDSTIIKEIIRPNHYFLRVREINAAVNTITQTVLKVANYDKKKTLIKMLLEKSVFVSEDSRYNTEKTIVFKNGRRECDRLGIILAYYDFRVITLNSDRTQDQRWNAVDKFTKGEYHILVATDVAARGLNFPNVARVINYDMPRKDHYMQYIHRIGRTGRAGNVGHSCSFFDPMSEDCVNAKYLIEVLEDSNQIVPDFLRNIVRAQEMVIDEHEHQTHEMVIDEHEHQEMVPNDVDSSAQGKNSTYLDVDIDDTW